VPAQDLVEGARLFSKCLPCHTVGTGASNGIGPVLNGLDGRKAGSVVGYSYTDAHRKSAVTFNEQTFSDYVRNPRAEIPETLMRMTGVTNDKEIAALWAYLKRFARDGSIKKQ
jgi:cytochrome c